MAGMMGQLRVLTLNQGENLEVTLFRLEKAWTLHFVLGPSLADKRVRIFTNHPANPKQGSNRNLYRELQWQNYSGHKSDVYDNYAEVPLVLSGSFNYFFSIDGSADAKNPNGSGYFVVDPVLRSGQYDEKVPLDCISCQSVLAKSLGPFNEWEDRLRVAKESGYNMIHFTPLQELGASNSSYALSDQLKLNPIFSPGQKQFNFKDVDELVKRMSKEWEVLSLTDLVFNHTANESVWIQEHPECAYNVINSPHLKPAYLLDRILWHFSLEVGEGKWADKGIPPQISSEDHVNSIDWHLRNVVLPKYKIHEYFQVDVKAIVQQFERAAMNDVKGMEKPEQSLAIIPDPQYRRLKGAVDLHLALHQYYTLNTFNLAKNEHVKNCCAAFEQRLNELNGEKYHETQDHLSAAVTNFIANARWRFLDQNGPKVKAVSAKEPIMYNYFILPREKMTVEKEEQLMHTEAGKFCMAHNGWVMNDDPMRNFAEPGSNIYLRRELLPWGDSVKLRYGKKPSDCPYLWEHMKKYTVETVKIFHGVRLDNCHSTPIHVAEFMLDEARKVRPDLYVIAELFTSSEQKDNVFINRLGLSSLIREGQSAWDSHELGRLVHRFGGSPVGAFIQPPARPLMPTMAHAMFMDQTHDNPSPIEKRSPYDILASTALVSMACCATGSNRGYDEIVPHHINVVTEPRLYTSWNENAKGAGFINIKTGIIAAKRALNNLHKDLGTAGFSQVYVDQVDGNIVSVTRHNPVSHQSVIMVSRTSFGHPERLDTGFVPPLVVPGVVDEIILEASIVAKNASATYKKDPKFINGLPEYHLNLREHIKLTESSLVEQTECDNQVQNIEFVNFPPGSVIVFKVSLSSPNKASILKIRACLSQFGYRMHTYSGRNLQQISSTDLEGIAARLSLADINRVMFRCHEEEADDGKGGGVYDVPNYGKLTYSGLHGVMAVLMKIRAHNDLGHPLIGNVRDGDWMLHYIANRLKAFPGTKDLGNWFEQVFGHLSKIPRYLIPCYFDAIITGVYMIVEEVAWAKMSEFIRDGSTFVRALSLGSIQFCSFVKTAPLPGLSPALAAPKPPSIVDEYTGKPVPACITLCAGLPHFSSGIFRNWGRDTFIALRGLLLVTGRYADARLMILGYGGTLRHGLIPNLLGAGISARYNCRDAVWFWLQCIQDYCKIVPDGAKILKDVVSRLYPDDNSAPLNPGNADQPLHDVIQEAMQRHADGLKFRERNAGRGIDNDMSDDGFNNEIGVHWDTGFVYGGNANNCGTWMDKMGSSEKAGNKGVPATPRDGSAVELVGLCKSAVRWLAQMNQAGLYPYDGVSTRINGKAVKVKYSDWAAKINTTFEQCFWVSDAVTPQDSKLINRRGIYKDSFGASHDYADYQLRCNFPVAMVVAPEMFNPVKAWKALSQVQEVLLGPLGMRTLDPSDWAYNGNYINSDDSSDYNKARGFNYHQGPEWLWPVGYFLRAKLLMAQKLEAANKGILDATIHFVKYTMSAHNVHMQENDWKSLPELTNKDGAVCGDSCVAQAWSVGCLLEVLHDVEMLCKDKSG